jgi:glucokinase
MKVLVGIDIGGTKCAVVLGCRDSEQMKILAKQRFPTPPGPDRTLDLLAAALQQLLQEQGVEAGAIGVSCGGPLDSSRGLLLGPPNLPGWDHVEVVSYFAHRFGVPTQLHNDANAGALAEWRWGAGQGCRNLVFLTFGTGMGAGLILNGGLYVGTNDMAGEVGHVRLQADGPIGYGKAGSFEGFCSGGGIKRLATELAREALAKGTPPAFCPTPGDLEGITAYSVALAAHQNDPLALRVWETVGRELGRGLAILVDMINPQRIILGGIYPRQRSLLDPILQEELHREALSLSLGVCSIVPASLGEQIGDYASLAVASLLDPYSV